MFILAITTDDKLVNQLKNVGQVMKCTSAEMATDMIKSGEFDAVVLGSPYTDINVKTLKHDNVIVIKTKEDLTKFIKSKKKPSIFDEFASGVPDEVIKPVRKLRGAEPEPEAALVVPKEIGRILLVTLNLELVKYFSEFDIRIATTKYSAEKALPCNPKIVIWDIPEEPMEMTKVLLYKWGIDLLHKEDVIQVLKNTDL